MGKWYVSIDAPFGGFAPGYSENTYPSYGNKNQARAMTNIDMTDPTGFKQGPGLSTLTNGTEAGAVTTLIKYIWPIPPVADVTYGVGGALLYKITPTEVTDDATWPHTIDKAVVTGEDGESCFVINGALYYLYNHSGSAGDIGKFDLSATFDDDWGSTVPTGAEALQNAPHPSVVGNDNVSYFGNGAGVGYFDPDTNTLSAIDLDIPTGSQVVDVRYKDSRVWLAANFPNLTGVNNTIGIVYVWGGVGVSSWDDFPNPRINGKIGAMLNIGSTMFIWYQEVGFTGGYKLGYIRGNEVVELESYSGTLPNFAQVFELRGHIAWQSNGLLHLWGSSNKKIPVAHSQYMDLGYSTIGGVATPFGVVMAASNQSSSYKIAKASGYDTSSSWKEVMLGFGPSMVDKVRVHFTPPSTGARVDIKLTRDQGLETKTLTRKGQTGSITAANDANRCFKDFAPSLTIQDEVSVEADFTNGSSSNPVLIRQIEVWGHTVDKD